MEEQLQELITQQGDRKSRMNEASKKWKLNNKDKNKQKNREYQEAFRKRNKVIVEDPAHVAYPEVVINKEIYIEPEQIEIEPINYDPVEVIKKYKSITTLYDGLIYGLYMLLEPRGLDYHSIKITDEENFDILNDENYLCRLDNDCYFIFNKYTGYAKTGKQVIICPKTLYELLEAYLNDCEIDVNDYLFYSKNRRKIAITPSLFASHIKRTFKNIYGIDGITTKILKQNYMEYNKN